MTLQYQFYFQKFLRTFEIASKIQKYEVLTMEISEELKKLNPADPEIKIFGEIAGRSFSLWQIFFLPGKHICSSDGI